jgi:mannosyltransferase OCH1-like enzyme
MSQKCIQHGLAKHQIPKHIYQSWKTKNLSPEMKKNVEKIQKLNPEYTYHLYDDEDCKAFLFRHFGQNYVNAFDAILPGAFKCDFWRYAILYIEGGVYFDMDMLPLVPFDSIINEYDEFISVVDNQTFYEPECKVFQAFIACKPKHPILLNALQLSFSNISMRRCDELEVLNVTGPIVMGVAINLFLGKQNTHSKIKSGKYKKLKLLKVQTKGYDVVAVRDLKNQTIFVNKYKGSISNSYFLTKFYQDDPRRIKRYVIRFILITWILLLIYFCIKQK